MMARLGGADEIVVRDIQRRQQVAKLLRLPGRRTRGLEPGLLRRALDLLAVLVGAGEKEQRRRPSGDAHAPRIATIVV
jgi:hypothetical protein